MIPDIEWDVHSSSGLLVVVVVVVIVKFGHPPCSPESSRSRGCTTTMQPRIIPQDARVCFVLRDLSPQVSSASRARMLEVRTSLRPMDTPCLSGVAMETSPHGAFMSSTWHYERNEPRAVGLSVRMHQHYNLTNLEKW